MDKVFKNLLIEVSILAGTLALLAMVLKLWQLCSALCEDEPTPVPTPVPTPEPTPAPPTTPATPPPPMASPEDDDEDDDDGDVGIEMRVFVTGSAP